MTIYVPFVLIMWFSNIAVSYSQLDGLIFSNNNIRPSAQIIAGVFPSSTYNQNPLPGVGSNQNLIPGTGFNPNVFISSGSAGIDAISNAVGVGCSCLIASSCPNINPNTLMDIRIVSGVINNNYQQCPVGYILCCSNNNNNLVPNPLITDSTCGIRKIPTQTQSIPGQASFGSYPWQAALLSLTGSYLGSGVLIDSSHVLTTAHKVQQYAGGNFLVRLGEWNSQSDAEPYSYVQASVTRVIIHPNYNPTNLHNDIAIIKLNAIVPVASYPNINTACLPSQPIAANSRCWVSGWGKDAFGATGIYQSTMKEVDVPIVDQTECENRFRATRLGSTFLLNRQSFLCAGGELGKDACTGDGGSPLVCQATSGQWQIHGLVSWGIGCANAGVPGVYVNVFNYLPWLNQQLLIN